MKKKIINEIKSIAVTFIAFLAIDGGASLMQVYNGDLSSTVLTALGLAAVRSLVKTILVLVFPSLFKSQ